jgi:predicted Zn-dependent protease
MSDRLAVARDYVRRKPTDRFGLYTLGMELRKIKAWDECFSTFRTLLEQNPDYAPGWYHYAMARRESGDRAGTIDTLKLGLDAAARSGDGKTRAELQSALDELLDADE